MNAILKYGIAVTAMVIATQATAQVVFYEHEDFEGRSFATESQVNDLQNHGRRNDARDSRGGRDGRDDRYDNRRDGQRYGFNNHASSAVVLRNRWEVCERAGFRGRCIVLRPGRYPSLAAMGLNDHVSSVRIVGRNVRINDDRYAPEASPVYDNHRRNNERLFEVEVTSARAVVGPPEQRCWIEREEDVQDRRRPNVPGAILGAVIGGVLGHQVGGGRGKDIATVGGVVAGAAVGANVNRGRNGQQINSHDVERCEDVQRQSRPDYWDVTYDFRGLEHRIQMTNPPGRTVTVNRDGEPRA